MAYVTQQQLINRFTEEDLIELTDRTGMQVINTTVLAAAIADASATIDSYLQQVRTLPLSQTVIDASPLARICGDLVRFYLYEEAPDHVETAHDKAVQWLRDIAAGRASLGKEDAPAASGSGGRFVTAQGVSATDWSTYD